MKLNRELSQLCWLEVKHFVQDDTKSAKILLSCAQHITPMSVAN